MKIVQRMLCGIFLLGASWAVVEAVPARVERVSIQYGTKRPYSFYYPYNYQYYTPRTRYYSNLSAGACYWIYVNGTYVYKCD